MPKVTLENYQELAEGTSATASRSGRQVSSNRIGAGENVRLLHGAMGICTEAGELQDSLKKYIFYGKGVDRLNVLEELGDLLWYIAEIANALGAPLRKIMEMNIDKLAERYPDKFTEVDALERNLDAELVAMQKNLPNDVEISE